MSRHKDLKPNLKSPKEPTEVDQYSHGTTAPRHHGNTTSNREPIGSSATKQRPARNSQRSTKPNRERKQREHPRASPITTEEDINIRQTLKRLLQIS